MHEHMLPMTGTAKNVKRCDFPPKLHFSRDRVNILTTRRDWRADGSLGVSLQISSENFGPSESFCRKIQKARPWIADGQAGGVQGAVAATWCGGFCVGGRELSPFLWADTGQAARYPQTQPGPPRPPPRPALAVTGTWGTGQGPSPLTGEPGPRWRVAQPGRRSSCDHSCDHSCLQLHVCRAPVTDLGTEDFLRCHHSDASA